MSASKNKKQESQQGLKRPVVKISLAKNGPIIFGIGNILLQRTDTNPEPSGEFTIADEVECRSIISAAHYGTIIISSADITEVHNYLSALTGVDESQSQPSQKKNAPQTITIYLDKSRPLWATRDGRISLNRLGGETSKTLNTASVLPLQRVDIDNGITNGYIHLEQQSESAELKSMDIDTSFENRDPKDEVANFLLDHPIESFKTMSKEFSRPLLIKLRGIETADRNRKEYHAAINVGLDVAQK